MSFEDQGSSLEGMSTYFVVVVQLFPIMRELHFKSARNSTIFASFNFFFTVYMYIKYCFKFCIMTVCFATFGFPCLFET